MRFGLLSTHKLCLISLKTINNKTSDLSGDLRILICVCVCTLETGDVEVHILQFVINTMYNHILALT